MVALVFLGLAIVCTIIGRILLLTAAFGVSIWWGFGVFLPFGPLLFRLSYPELAPTSRIFRLAAHPCLLAYFVLQPNPVSRFHYPDFFKSANAPAAPANHYGLEPKPKPQLPTLAERRVANAREIERLQVWNEKLRVQKRDLLNSDTEGNLVYNIEVAKYNAAAKAALAERDALAQVQK
jgi:hypothetical protein